MRRERYACCDLVVGSKEAKPIIILLSWRVPATAQSEHIEIYLERRRELQLNVRATFLMMLEQLLVKNTRMEIMKLPTPERGVPRLDLLFFIWIRIPPVVLPMQAHDGERRRW
jgi:hypothetical protein